MPVAARQERLHRQQRVHLAVPHALGGEGGRRLHGDERQHLHQVVLHHVAQCACALVVRRAVLDADGFCGRDLDVVDVAAVPDRFEHAVAEAEHQQVLDGFLPQIVIDAIDLIFVEVLVRQPIERARAVEVGAERLLHDNAPPTPGRCVGQTRCPQLLDHGRIDRRRNSEVEEHALGPVDLGQARLQPLVQPGVVGFARHVVHPAGERRGDFVTIGVGPGELLQAVAELGPECLIVHLAPRDADDGELRRQAAATRQAIDRGQELAAREVARCTKDDERRRPRGRFEPKPIMKGIGRHLPRSYDGCASPGPGAWSTSQEPSPLSPRRARKQWIRSLFLLTPAHSWNLIKTWLTHLSAAPHSTRDREPAAGRVIGCAGSQPS